MTHKKITLLGAAIVLQTLVSEIVLSHTFHLQTRRLLAVLLLVQFLTLPILYAALRHAKKV